MAMEPGRKNDTSALSEILRFISKILRGKIVKMLTFVNPGGRISIWLSYYSPYFSTFHQFKKIIGKGH